MGDHKNRTLIPYEIILQKCDYFTVHMIRRLIQNKEIALACENCCNGHFFSLSTGQGLHLCIKVVDAQPGQHALALVFLTWQVLHTRIRHSLLHHRQITVKGWILRQISLHQLIGGCNCAALLIHYSCNYLQKGGFSASVYSDKPDFVARTDGQIYILQQSLLRIAFLDVFR